MSPSSLSAVTIRIMMLLVAGIALELLADFEAAELRHHDVEQNQMRLERRDLVERVLPIDRHGRLDVQSARYASSSSTLGSLSSAIRMRLLSGLVAHRAFLILMVR